MSAELPQTVIRWEFRNPMAPNVPNYAPTIFGGARIVQVETTKVGTKTEMSVWFATDEPTAEVKREAYIMHLGNTFGDYLYRSDPAQRAFTLAGVKLKPGKHKAWETFSNGLSVKTTFTFDLHSEGFIAASYRKFGTLMELIVLEEWRKKYKLPQAEIFKQTLVRSNSAWVPYGQYLWGAISMQYDHLSHFE